MSNRSIAVLVFLFGIISAQIPAQKKTWSFKDCLAQALDKNVALNQDRLSSDVNKVNLDQSRANLLPNLNLSDGQNFSFGRSLDPNTYQFTNQHISTNSFSATSNVVLFNGFYYLNTIRQNQYFYQAGLSDVERMKNDLSLNVLAAFIQVLVNEEAVSIADNQLQATTAQVSRTEAFVKAGKLAESNLFQLQAQLASDQLSKVNAESQLQISKVTLLQLMETPVFPEFEVEKPEAGNLLPSAISDPANLYKSAESIMPQIKSAESNTQAYNYGYKVSRSLYMPRLSLGGTLRTSYSSFAGRYSYSTLYQQENIGFLQSNPAEQVIGIVPVNTVVKGDYPLANQLSDNFGQVVSLSLTVPIFNNFQARYGMQKAKISIANAQLNEQAVKNALRKSIEQACTDLLASGNRYLASQEQLKSEERAYQDMEKKYSYGSATAIDYLIEKNNYLKSQQALIQAKYDYLLKSRVIDFYSGKPISL